MKKSFKIPNEIELFGSIIKTVYCQQLLDEFKLLAQYNTNFDEIRLKKRFEDRDIPEDCLFISYIHELIHAMLSKLGYIELSDDEKFVEGFSNLLVQILKQLI